MLEIEKLKKDYLGKEVKLLNLDNEMCDLLGTSSIFEYNLKEMLEDGFTYMQDECEGYNFYFEVIEFDEKEPLKAVVKVTSIDLV